MCVWLCGCELTTPPSPFVDPLIFVFSPNFLQKLEKSLFFFWTNKKAPLYIERSYATFGLKQPNPVPNSSNHHPPISRNKISTVGYLPN